MRNAFLIFLLANVLLFAWQFWIDPAPRPQPMAEATSLILFGSDGGRTSSGSGGSMAGQAPSPAQTPVAAPTATCFRLGPLASVAAAQQARERLAGGGIDATPIALDTQVWLGHWVQISGFPSTKEAEAARQRLAAGGIADIYLMQEGAQPMLSLGVFRERSRADRVASAAGSLGFQVTLRDRYRPTVEQWLLIRPRPDQALVPADVSLASDRILRSEPAPCAETAPGLPPVSP